MATNEPSVETIPNNVFVRHPTHGEGHLVPFGMYIQPATISIGDVIVSGQKCVSKEEGALADQAKVLVGDLLVALDDIFVDQISLGDVLNLFKKLPPNFSMTVIRQDTEAEGAPKYKGLKISIELGVDKESNNVVVISSSCEPEDLYVYNQTVPSKLVAQVLVGNLTKYIKATSNTTVAMQTWAGQAKKDQYIFDLYVYNSVNDGPTAITFYNEKYQASITISEPEADGKIGLEPSKAKPPSGFVKPTYNFFANMFTGTFDEFGFESILIANNYMTSESNDSLVLTTETVEPKDLPKASRYFVALQISDDEEETAGADAGM